MSRPNQTRARLHRQRQTRGASRLRRGLLAVLSGLGLPLFMLLLYSGWYALPRHTSNWDFPPTKLALSSPLYVAANMEEEMRVAIRNTYTSTVQATYRLDSNPFMLVFVTQGGTNTFWNGELNGLEQIDRTVRVYVPYDFWGGQATNTLGDNLGLSIWGQIDGQSPGQTPRLPIAVAPIPGVRKLFASTATILAGLVAWFAKEWWDAFKKDLEK